MLQTQAVTDLVESHGLDVETVRNGSIDPSVFLVIEVKRRGRGTIRGVYNDRASGREVRVSKNTSYHTVVWIIRLSPFDEDIRVGVPSHLGER
jgi:hypothetical protein